MTTISRNDSPPPQRWVVMGVSGCGKSSLGQALASTLGVPLVEGDDFHPPSNIEKMRNGIALTDQDRAGWLDALGRELAARPDGAVLTCSALKKSYRDVLRSAAPGLRFVYMHITRDEARARVQARAATHFFSSSSLVDNQFETLEDPRQEAGVVTVDATQPIDVLVGQVARAAHPAG